MGVLMVQGYAKVTVYEVPNEPTTEYAATVRTIRPNGQTGSAYRFVSYADYAGFPFSLADGEDQTLEVANIGTKPIVVYVDYFHPDGRPWFSPPKSSQDTFTLNVNPTPQGGGQMHTFSVKGFCEIP